MYVYDICRERERERERDYEELAHAITEAEKSYNLLSARWSPRKASVLI